MKSITISHKSKILIVDNYPEHNSLKKEIVPYLETYPDHQKRTTNVKATMTEWNISSPNIELLKKYILNKCRSFIEFNARPEITMLWANIYNKNDYALEHDHIPSNLSFAYFLKTKKYYSPLYFKTSLWKKTIIPKEGRLVIFPSYLKHGVPKHKYSDTRITLSGNINLWKY